MKLIFKQKIFSWFDSYDIYNEDEQIEYKVKGKLAFGHKFEIYDKNDNMVGMVKERILTFLPKFQIYVDNKVIGEIKKEFTFFKPKFTLNFNNWQVVGDIWEWNYKVVDGEETIMTATKELFHLTDYYKIDITKEENVLYSLMIVLAIDAAKCDQNNRNN